MSKLNELTVETFNFNETGFNHINSSQFCDSFDNWNNDFQSHVTVDHVLSEKGVNHNFANNGFYFVYRTNDTEASIFRCHTCPELPLNVMRVHGTIMVHFGHTVKLNN